MRDKDFLRRRAEEAREIIEQLLWVLQVKSEDPKATILAVTKARDFLEKDELLDDLRSRLDSESGPE